MKIDLPVPSSTPVGKSMIISALHASRRREAINVIHRYQNLISDRVETNICDSISSLDTKTRVRQILNSKKDRNVRRLSETNLIIMVLLGFGIVHVISGILIARAETEHGSRPITIAAWGD